MSDIAVTGDNGTVATVSTGSVLQATLTPATPAAFVVSGALQGPKGDTGPAGAAGATGATGPAGGVTSVNGQTGVVTLSIPTVTGTNTGDETTATIKSKLGITTLSGSNTGDQDLSSYATTTSVTTGLAGKANTTHSHTESDVTGLTTDLAAKQATLVSGTNIKTINSTSLLGSGDIVISGGTSSDATTTAKGIVQLAGDLSGTAAAPTVPGLTTKAPLASPTLTGTPGISGTSGTLSIYSNVDGGEYNIGASATGKLAIFGSAANTLDVNLLDGALYVASTLILTNARVMSNVSFTGSGNTWPTFNQNTTGTASTITGSITESQVTNLTTDLAAKATDTAVVHNTGNETIAGEKTFSNLQHDTIGDIDLNGMTIYKPAAQRTWYAPETVITNFQSGHGWVLQSGTGTQADDTTKFVKGTQSLKLTTDGAGVNVFTRSPVISPTIDLTGKQLRGWFYIDKPANLSTLRLEFTSDSFASAWFNWFPTDDIIQVKANTWVPLTFTFGRGLSLNGAPNRAAINKIQLLAKDDGTTPVNINFGGFASFPEPREGVVSLTFDDAWDSQFNVARPKLDQYGMRATAYVITDSNHHDVTNYMTTAQLKLLQDQSGWDISCHTNSHPFLTSLTPAQIESEFYTSKNWLLKNGFVRGADDMALPNGDYDETTVLPIASKYFRSIRTTATYTETLPAAHNLKLRTYLILNTSTTAQIQAAIDQAKANKEWLIFTFHKIVASPTVSTEFSTTNFNTIIDYLAASGVAVRTMSEVLNSYAPAYSNIPESAVTNLTTDLAAKQGTLTLTTTGTSGAATLTGATLNIPNYVASGGGITRSINTITTTTTAGATASTDYVYFCNGTFTLTLPAAASNTNRYTVKNVGSGVITVAGTIDGGTNAVLSTQYQSIDLLSNNTSWNVV